MRMMAGPYAVEVTVRANCRRMILRCRRAERTLALSVPKGTTQAAVRDFLARNMPWIEKQMGEAVAWQATYAPGERHFCLGRMVTLGVEAPAGEAFLRWRREQFTAVLRRLLDRWTKAMGVSITHVTLQEMTSRWGSCRSATRRLTFNTKLEMYGEELIEEVAVHELCHLFHANHSAAFYALMTRWLPDWKSRRIRRDHLDVRPQKPESHG